MEQLDRQYLGRDHFPIGLSESEIAHFFALSAEERQAVLRRRRPLNRLGVALQIGHLRLTGTPMNAVQMIPPEILAYVGRELGIPTPQLASMRALYRRRRTLFEHQAAAKEVLGLRELSDHAERSLTGFFAAKRESDIRSAN